MANKMLIDASHPEETRVVVLRGNRVEEFDFESASKKQLRGNIYLAKVTRVEPSLQAAFVEYGGNRHGFLAFSEIHPDYYQIPVADRQALIEEEAREDEDEEEQEERRPRRSRRRRREAPAERRHAAADEVVTEAEPADATAASAEETAEAALTQNDDQDIDPAPGLPPASPDAAAEWAPILPDEESSGVAPQAEDGAPAERAMASGGGGPATGAEPPANTNEAVADDLPRDLESREADPDHADASGLDEDEDDEEDEEEEHVEQIGGDALEEAPRRKPRLRRHYKIQEVIKRRQILLVQVVKEERGNKGAALTTYLSLAGRYSVLMPNTARGGGISRKITDSGDRKRLKSIVQDLDVPEGMGIILRTAGASRTRAEVKRDFEYLLRMWEKVRELTLSSSAPKLVYEEGSLIKRGIRDLYNKDVDEVLVAGDEAWREAKDFMRLIMPSHARNVVPWRDPQPIFARHGVEAQLDAMFSNHVTLRSGGYLVINQTEALVAIDVNSGRSTREHNIEDTALRTNLEAADEVARQLRLRDLAGLIVVDFIDMEEHRNNRAVERRLKEALKNDRARIQVGRISHFGLLEMSRQRIRAGVIEGSTAPCPHCAGSGMVRSVSSVALHVLRVLEDGLTKSATHDLIVHTRTDVALYILNEKRSHLREIERRFGVHVTVAADERMTGTTYHAIERGEPASGVPEPYVPTPYEPEPEDDAVEPVEAEFEDGTEPADALVASEPVEDGGEAAAEPGDAEGEDNKGRRRRRRRRRGGRGDREGAEAAQPPGDGLDGAAGPEADGFVQGDPADGGREGYWAREGTSAPVPFEAPRDGSGEDAAIVAPDPVNASESWYADVTGAPVEAVLDENDPSAPGGRSQSSAPIASTETPSADRAPRDMQIVAAEPAPSNGAALDASPQPPAAQPPRDPGPADQAAAQPVPPPSDAQPPRPDPEPAPVPPPREPTEVVITQADPDRPKRGGWWQRAKATLGGGTP